MGQVRPARRQRSRGALYVDQPDRSPWIAQLAPDGPPRPLDAAVSTDVAIVGAGIAGVATAFFTLRETAKRVLLIERGRISRNGRPAAVFNDRQVSGKFQFIGEVLAIEKCDTMSLAREKVRSRCSSRTRADHRHIPVTAHVLP